jgi:RNA polymerase sigma factor (sigma-70 family)
LPEMEQLVRQARSGDVDAFTQLVERFQHMAYGYAYAYLNDFDLAQDAAQEAFIEAYRSLADLREAATFPAWFKRILFKYCDRQVRSRRPPPAPLDEIVEPVSDLPSPPDAAERNELARCVRSAIYELPIDQRVATTLFYINGYSQQEIAEFLEVPPKTVKSRLHTSRQKLKQRMVDMMEDELKNHGLPDDFTRQTVEQAVQQARELNNAGQFNQAEGVLRQAISHAPGHPDALKELNRSIMRGQVYQHGRWDLLPELVRHGQAILAVDASEDIRRELAHTLLAIPAMPAAIDFLRQWNEVSGPDLERLGMLSWATACTGDYDIAAELWRDLLTYTRGDEAHNPGPTLALIAHSLVDCFASAGQIERASEFAQQGWAVAQQGPAATISGRLPVDAAALMWLKTLFQAGLSYQDAARMLLTNLDPDEPDTSGLRLCLRAYFEDPHVLTLDWLNFVRACMLAGDYERFGKLRFEITAPLRMRGLPQAHINLGQSTWALLDASPDPHAERLKLPWNWERFNFFSFVDQKDWDAVERISWQGIRELEMDSNASGVIVACAATGKPTPPELLHAAHQGGIESVDSYGLYGWYMLAREAAAAGDSPQAFEALTRSLGYWSNPPLLMMNVWENDTRWGTLRETAEFRRIFQEKRDRIGPIHGMLHYFPGW